MKKLIKVITIRMFSILFIVNPAIAGGILVVSPAGNNITGTQRIAPYTLTVKSLDIEAKIENGNAFTTIKQVFHNSSALRLQGYFLFPVPANSVIRNFQMDINGKMTKAELLEASEAQKIYEEIVRKTLDPALLEYSGYNLFKIRIFPIEPNSDKTIKISYNSLLTKDNLLTSYTLPLNTQKFSAQALNDVNIHIKINSPTKIASVYSPTHQIETTQLNENSYEINYTAKSIKPNSDFKLYIQESKHEINISSIAYKDLNNNGFVLLDISPNFYSKQKEAKNYTFIVDVSGSMRDNKIIQAQKAIKYCVNQLDENDNFQMIRFSTYANKEFSQMSKASDKNKALAIAKIDNWEAIGGTNVEAAFKLAFEEQEDETRKHLIVFITDGKPTIGETDENKLLKYISSKNSSQLRIFTFGIGNDLNTHLLDKISTETNAYRSYISENEKIDERITAFFDKVQRPAISNLKIELGGTISITDIIPQQLPDLFYGQNLVVVGKIDKKGEFKIKLKGFLNKKEIKMEESLTVKFSPENSFIPLIWATRQIGTLLEQIRLNGETEDLKDEIVHLAKKYGIISPYTSYLILEDAEIVSNETINHQEIRYKKFLSENINMEEAESEYKEMQKKSGINSTRGSAEIQQLSKSKNVNDLNVGQNRISIKNSRFEQNYKNIQGIAFYKTNNIWVDSQLSEIKISYKTKKIKFASKEYFNELVSYPELAYLFSLGKNCKFVYKSTIYHITE